MDPNVRTDEKEEMPEVAVMEAKPIEEVKPEAEVTAVADEAKTGPEPV